MRGVCVSSCLFLHRGRSALRARLSTCLALLPSPHLCLHSTSVLRHSHTYSPDAASPARGQRVGPRRGVWGGLARPLSRAGMQKMWKQLRSESSGLFIAARWQRVFSPGENGRRRGQLIAMVGPEKEKEHASPLTGLQFEGRQAAYTMQTPPSHVECQERRWNRQE